MEAAAFREVVLRHKDRVHAYAVWMLGNAEEARDVAQEVLVRLWQNTAKVEIDLALPWLLRTTYRLCIDKTRRRKVRSEVSGDGVLDPVPAGDPGPDRRAVSDEVGRAIAAALDRLHEVDRAVVVMREVQGMSYEEIAGALGLPLGTVKAKLHRARDRMRRDLVGAGVTP